MNETRRLTYLAHFGIDYYLARRPLQGAAPSIVSGVLDVSIPDLQEATVETLSSPLSINATINDTESDSDVDSKTTVINTSSSLTKHQTKTVHFSLHCWRIHDDLLVLDTHEPGAALPTDTLLLNIVRSLGYPLEQLPQSEPLRWPLFESDQQANDENQARAMVQAYIQAQLSKQPANHLLLMGTDAARFTLDTFDDWQSVEGKRFQQWQMTLIAIPSLADMLREPLLKRVVWETVKALICPLKSHY